MAIKGNISNTPNGVIGHIQADINVYHGIETDSAKVTVDNRRKEIKVDVKEEFLDNKQDKLTAGENITIDENNVISATGGSGGSSVIPNPEVIGTEPLLNSIQIDGDKFRIGGSGGNVNIEAGNGISITGDETKTISVNEDVAMKTDIPSLDGYATETWVQNQGYLTSVSWDDIFDKPTFATVATTGDYDDLTNKPTIPTATSDLTNDSGFITGISSSDVITALGYTPGTSNFSGDYDDLTNKPTIPDAVSGTNDGTNWTSLTIGEDTYGLAGIDIDDQEIENYFDEYCNIHGKVTNEIIDGNNVNVLNLDNVELENNSSSEYITLDFNADNVSAGNKILNIE